MQTMTPQHELPKTLLEPGIAMDVSAAVDAR
jgi:hypothetical protein